MTDWMRLNYGKVRLDDIQGKRLREHIGTESSISWNAPLVSGTTRRLAGVISDWGMT